MEQQNGRYGKMKNNGIIGGKVVMALAKTFFSPRFGMVADTFGVTWMVIVTPTE